MMIRNDQAIKSQGEDLLGRAKFAENIAKAILTWRSKDCICMALHGPWGSGKSSVLNMAIEFIENDSANKPESERPMIIRFQPWMFSSQEHLVKAFLWQLKTMLKKTSASEYAQKAAQSLEKYETLLGFTSFIPVIGGYAERAKDVVGGARKAAIAFSRNSDGDLDSLKKLICDALEKLPASIIVVIDDVDRLTDSEVRQLFQLIKAVADFKNTIYILAFDRALITKSLESMQAGSDTDYIEKIVQLDFEIPQPSHSVIAGYLWEELLKIVGDLNHQGTEQERWDEVRLGYLPYLFNSMRDVKRYLNMVEFRYPLVSGEVSVVDMLILEALRMFVPNIYEVIKLNGDQFASDSSARHYGLTGKNEERKEWLQEIVGLAPESKRAIIKNLLKQLFPEVRAIYDNISWGGNVHKDWGKERRVCISSYFDYYFQTSVPDGEVSEFETDKLAELLGDPKTLTLALGNYIDDGRLKKVLLKLENRIEDDIYAIKVQNLIIALSQTVENIEQSPRGFYEMPLKLSLLYMLIRLIEKLPKDERKNVISEAVQSLKDVVCIPVEVIDYIWSEWDPKWSKSDKTEEERILSKNDASELKELGLSLIHKCKEDGTLISSYSLLHTLYVWGRWEDERIVKDWVASILENKENIPLFLMKCGSWTTSMVVGSAVSNSQFRIDRKSLKAFCDVEALKDYCKSLLEESPAWLEENSKEILMIYIKGFDANNDW